jgi:hypothetical protein
LLIMQVFSWIQERFADRSKSISILLQTSMMLIIFWKPNGLLDFDRLEGKNILIALSEGSANCRTLLTLKENGKFRERTTCFGIEDIKGQYEIRNDTIFFTRISFNFHQKGYYNFAVIKPYSQRRGDPSTNLVLYINKEDTSGFWLPIKKNELGKLYLKK